MNKDIRKYIANCTLCHREKAKVQNYPLQMMEIPDRPFDKIAIDLVTECETSKSGHRHILTIIDHLTGWPEAFPISDRSADTIVSTFINKYLCKGAECQGHLLRGSCLVPYPVDNCSGAVTTRC